MKLAVPRYAGSLLFGLLLASVTVLALLPKPPAAAGLGWDKLNHVLAFVALGQSARWAWPTARWGGWGSALLGYGLLLELAQGWMPPREADALDLLADALGLLLVVLLNRRRATGPAPRATPPDRPR
jgi:VanZ family protein